MVPEQTAHLPLGSVRDCCALGRFEGEKGVHVVLFIEIDGDIKMHARHDNWSQKKGILPIRRHFLTPLKQHKPMLPPFFLRRRAQETRHNIPLPHFRRRRLYLGHSARGVQRSSSVQGRIEIAIEAVCQGTAEGERHFRG